jgi:hypothetical protein
MVIERAVRSEAVTTLVVVGGSETPYLSTIVPSLYFSVQFTVNELDADVSDVILQALFIVAAVVASTCTGAADKPDANKDIDNETIRRSITTSSNKN